MKSNNEEKPNRSLISFFSSKVKKYGGINLAQGRPGFTPPAQLLEILKENIKNSDLHQYAPGDGDSDLIDVIIDKYAEISTLNKKNILITQGATEAIFLSFFYLANRLKKPFGILSFDPVYESYPKLPSITGMPFYYFKHGSDGSVDKKEFEKIVVKNKIKIVFIASPGNPRGKIWGKNEIEFISNLAEKHEFYVIFDNVYDDIYFTGKPFNPLHLRKSNLLYVNSFSKMLSITGWRIGYLITEEEHMNKIKNIHDYTGLSAPYLFQKTISQYLNTFNMGKDYIEIVRQKCKRNYFYLKDIFTKNGFSIPSAEGGYFLWAKIPGIFDDSFRFAEDLFEKTGVAVVPGENFSPFAKKYIRINIATDHTLVEKGAERIIRFVNQI